MFNLRRLFGKPRSDFPTKRDWQARLLTEGWTVNPAYMPGFHFIIQKGALRVALGWNYSDARQLDLSGTRELANNENAVCVILVAAAIPEYKQREAIEQFTLLLPYTAFDQLEDQVAALVRSNRERYLEAKSVLQRDEDAAQAPAAAAAPSSSGVVYGSKYIECTLVDRGDELLLVAFGDVSDLAGGPNLVADGTAAALGASLLCIRCTEPNFFPKHDMELFAARFTEAFRDRFSRRWSYGIAQGGYGALKYARLLGIERAVAVSPVMSIDKWDVTDHRYNQHFVDGLHYSMRVTHEDVCDDVVLIYDPFDHHDALQAGLAPAICRLHAFTLPFSGMATRWLLSSDEALRELLQACLANDWRRTQLLCALARKRIVDRPFSMAFALASRRPETAMRIFERYGKDDVRRWSSICFLLAKAGLAARVMPLLEVEAARHPNDVELNVCIAAIAIDTLEPAKALHHVAVGLLEDGMNPTYNWIKQTAETMLPPR